MKRLAPTFPLPLISLLAALPLLSILAAPACRAESPLFLLYSERPPQAFTRADAPGGQGVLLARRAFEDAGIAFTWQKMAPGQEWQAIAENMYPVCTPGWERTPQRDAIARFTRPLSQDGPLVGVANRDFRPPPGATLDQLLGQPGVDVLLAQGADFSPAVNDKLRTMRAHRQEAKPMFGYSGIKPGQVVALVAAGRAELTLVPSDELPFQLDAARLGREDVNVLALPDAPPGALRHIACSRQVDAKLVERLNRAIEHWGSLLPQY